MSENVSGKKSTERVAIFSAALFLFGLAGLITLHIVWPCILPLIFLMVVPIVIAEEGWRMGLWILTQTALWLGGISALIFMHFLWPGVLILAGLSTMIVAIAPPDKVEAASKRAKVKRDYAKAKRGLPLPLERSEELPMMDDDESSMQQRSTQH